MTTRTDLQFRKYIQIVVFFCCTFCASAQVSSHNWYVGNTETGEWIRYKKVWLSAGSYRFTVCAVAKSQGQTVHLDINDQTLQSHVQVPFNNADTFDLAHLGHIQLDEGYYDLKLVFETGNVNCDMIFIRKDNSTSGNVTSNDIAFSIKRTGTLMVPIGGAGGGSCLLAKGGDRGDDVIFTDNNNNPFTREQVLTWNKQQIYAYTPETSDQSNDMYISEVVAAKANVLYIHGRGENDSINDIDDRAYLTGVGNIGCRQIKKLVDAINRNTYARNNLKIAYFLDNAVFPLACSSYLHKTMNWGDPECQKFLWDYTFKKFYQTVPRNMLYFLPDGKIPIQLWSADANYDYTTSDAKILEFLQYIQSQMINTFGLTPSFILDRTFLKRDPRTRALAGGVQSWFSWGKNYTSIDTLNGKSYAFAFNGGRYPLRNVWLNDWDPATSTGTHATSTADYHFFTLDATGTPIIRPMYVQALAQNAQWLVMESWSDWREGSTWHRSNHPEYDYPNQFISLVREFADRNSESMVLEAEGCDDFYDLSPGNSGGAYRVNWYNDLKKDFWSSNKDIDLDIYRPLHRLSALQAGGNPGTPFAGFSAGYQDVWGFDASGKINTSEIDGHPVAWKTSNNALSKMKKIAVGKFYAYALTTDNKVMKNELPVGWPASNGTGWTDVTSGTVMKDIDVSLTMVWAVDNSGKVYYRNLSATLPWTNVPGNLASITADDQWVWGFAPSGKLVRMSVESKSKWDTIANPYQLTRIEAGACEVWGINANKEVYRINSSGEGKWQFVTRGYTNVSVGYEYVWLSDASGNMFKYEIKGFESASAFPVDPASFNGTISGSSKLCASASANSTILSLSGYSGNIVRWESSTDNWKTVNAIADTSTTYTALDMSASTKFRAVIQNGATQVNSAEAVIMVDSPSSGGTLTGDDFLCSGGNSTVLTLNGPTGNVVRWEFSTDNWITVTSIANTGLIQMANALTKDTRYRAVIQNGVCSAANSAEFLVHVNLPSIGGNIDGSAIVLQNTNSSTLILSGYTGNILGWESSSDNWSTVVPIANTTATFVASNLSASTRYRAIVQNTGCSAVRSSEGVISVTNPNTSVSDLKDGFGVRVNPNPFVGHLEVSIGSPVKTDATVILNDAHGEVVFKQTYSLLPGQNIIQLSEAAGLVPGVYMLIVSTPQGNKTVKLVKME